MTRNKTKDDIQYLIGLSLIFAQDAASWGLYRYTLIPFCLQGQSSRMPYMKNVSWCCMLLSVENPQECLIQFDEFST